MKMTQKQILEAHVYARYLSERLNASYWAKESREFLLAECPDELRKLAAAMGYEIVKKEEMPADA